MGVLTSDVDPDPVGSGSRGMKSLIKLRENQSLTNKNLFFSQEIIFFRSEHKKVGSERL